MIFGSQSEDIDEGGENENAGPDVSWMEKQEIWSKKKQYCFCSIFGPKAGLLLPQKCTGSCFYPIICSCITCSTRISVLPTRSKQSG